MRATKYKYNIITTRVCTGCQTLFESGHPTKKFCNPICKQRYYDSTRGPRKRIHSLVCEECGDPFDAKSKSTRFCGLSCSAKNKHRNNLLVNPTGPDSYLWKGGLEATLLRRRLKKYSLSIEEYEKLLLAQEGVCAICKQTGTKQLAIDHDHETGKVRGLLCSSCNTGLGLLGDSLEALKNVILYLEEAHA